MIKQRKFDPTVPLLLHGTASLESMRPIYLCRIDRTTVPFRRQQAMVVSKPSTAFAGLRLCVASLRPFSASVCGMQKSVLTNAAAGRLGATDATLFLRFQRRSLRFAGAACLIRRILIIRASYIYFIAMLF